MQYNISLTKNPSKEQKVPAPMLAGKVHGDLLLLGLQVTLSYNQKQKFVKVKSPMKNEQ